MNNQLSTIPYSRAACTSARLDRVKARTSLMSTSFKIEPRRVANSSARAAERYGPTRPSNLARSSEVLKKLPDLPIIMDKANDVMTLITEGKFNPNTMAYKSLKNEELKLEIIRNKILSGFLILVIFAVIVF